MTEISRTANKWVPWMHVAGIGYAIGLFLVITGYVTMDQTGHTIALIGTAALAVGTIAFIGGWGRYLSTKR